MNFLQILLPPSEEEVDARALRVRALQFILWAASVFGAALLAMSLPIAMQRAQWVFVGLYCAAYLFILLVTLIRTLPFAFRVDSFLFILFLLGVTGLLKTGLAGDGRMFLFGLVIATGVFLGLRAGLIALTSGVVAIFASGLLLTFGDVPGIILPETAYPGSLAEWVYAGLLFALITSLTLFSLDLLISALDRAVTRQKSLTAGMEAERAQLDERVAQRTADVQRRLTQLRTAAEVSRRISAELEPQALLNHVVNLLQERFSLYYAGVFLMEERNQYAILRAGTGEAGQKMIAQGHRLAVSDSSMIGWSMLHRMPRIALDVGAEALHFQNPYLPLTRSEMALPLISGDDVLGAVTIQSDQAGAFDEDDILILQGIADELAIALQNARLYQDASQSLEEIRSLHRQYLHRAWSTIQHHPEELRFTYKRPLEKFEEDETRVMRYAMTLREQQIGRLVVETGKSGLTAEDQSLIDAILAQTAQAVESARLLEESRRRVTREELLNKMSERFTRAIEIDTVLKTAVEELGRLPLVREASIYLESLPEQPPSDDQKSAD
jgi:GAF domain-containing protein